MRTLPIHLDRLDAALGTHGVVLKRAQLLETAAAAFGYHNSGELAAAAKRGDLDASPAVPIGRVSVDGTGLIAVRDGQGRVYAVEEEFLEQVVEEERRERYGPSPYGGLVDLSDVAAHPATAWTVTADREADVPRYVAVDEVERGTLIETDDEDAAREACRLHDGQYDLDAYVVDRVGWTISRARCCWREEPLSEVSADLAARATAAADLHMARIARDETQATNEKILRIDVPDWRTWEKSLKRASHKHQEPVTDEILHQIRHACADVTSKSSSSEKSEVTGRQQRYVEKHLGGLLARLDRAEEALREAGIAPAEIARKSREDAAERLAAIEAVAPRRAGGTVPRLHQVDATRDGARCRETFQTADGEDPEDRARAIAAKAFGMDLEDHRDEDGRLDEFDAECDSFYVEEVAYPPAAAVIGDALTELSMGGDFRFGMPTNHPARVKLLAAHDMIMPKPTV